MNHEIEVLRSLFSLAHKKQGPSLEQLTRKSRAPEEVVRRALFGLARNGLVQRTPGGLRLTLAGLAVAAAAAALPQAKPVRARPLPLVRRKRAA